MYWIVIGDIHEQTAMLARIPGLAEAEGVIVTGDLTNHGTAAAASRVLDAIAEYNPNILAQIGNMDTDAVAEVIRSRGYDLHREVADLFPDNESPKVGAFGVGFSAPTPFSTPSEVPDATLGQWCEEGWERCRGFGRTVAVVHNPPHGTRLDLLPGGMHVGSPAVRSFLEARQPAVCLTGHIHEARGVDMLGATTVLNPGMLAHGGYGVLTRTSSGVEVRLEVVS